MEKIPLRTICVFVALFVFAAWLAACTVQPVTPGTATETEVPAALNLRQVLAMRLQFDLSEVDIAHVEAVIWPDACLGKPDPAELCAPVETPGHRIVLTARGAEYIFHTAAEDNRLRLASAPEPIIAEPLLTWMQTDDSGCLEATFGVETLAFGRCGGVQMGVPYAVSQRPADLAEFVGTFAPFAAETPAGAVEFMGNDDTAATPAQQRMIAEWARLVQLEAQGGRSGASWGLVFAWHREGGAASFCDDVAVYVTGDLYVSSCRGEQSVELAHTRLDATQLAVLFGWLYAFQPFEYARTDQSDGSHSEPMSVRLVFSGAGEEEALEPQQALMIDFMQNLFNEGWMGASEPPAACPMPAAAQQLLIQPVLGYCLLYPAAYSLVQTNPTGMEIVMDTVMNHIDPRLSISVEEANGRTLADVADAIAADYAPPGFTIERTSITVDGVEAVMFDNLPGQDLNRRVVLVHNGRLYNFFLSPLGDPGTETRQQAETLHQTALDSFRWLAAGTPTASPMPTAALTSTPDTAVAPK